MSKKNSSAKRSWLGRLFFGGSKGLADDIEAKRAAKNDVEEIVSPVKQIVRGFMERKLAVGALCVVIAMFLLVFIGSLARAASLPMRHAPSSRLNSLWT